MQKNMGIVDKVVRLSLAATVGLLFLTSQISGNLATILGIGAAIFLLTGFIGYCPLYGVCNVSTKQTQPKEGSQQ